MTALGLSVREHRRRKYAPSADWLVRSAAAAGRSACGPSLISVRLRRIVFACLQSSRAPSFRDSGRGTADEDERAEFATFIALNPEAGFVIRGSGGIRKVRWAREGTGKSGGVRIVYLARNEAGEVYLLTLYAKSESENISLSTLKEIRRALEI